MEDNIKSLNLYKKKSNLEQDKDKKKKKRNIERSPRDYLWRIIVFFAISVFLLVLVGYNIFQVQIVNYDDYKDYAKGDHEKIESKEPYRGEIKDRNGKLLVSKEISFRTSIIPFYYNRDLSKNKTLKLKEIAEVLSGIDRKPGVINVEYRQTAIEKEYNTILKKLDRANKKIRRNKINKYDPLLIKDNITEFQAIILYEKADDYPWLTVTPSPERVYTLKESLAHVIGFTSPIFESEKEELLKKEDLYIHSSIIGRSGIEKQYDKELRGKIGKTAKLRNSRGRFLGKERELIPTIHGEDLYLTIDYGIQKIAYLAMGIFKGSVIVTKPATGEVLAMVSSPSYDPNSYYQNYRELLNDEGSPLLNRAISGIYPIGSIFKLVVSSAALESGRVNPKKKYNCKGYELIGRKDKIFKCTHVHGYLDLRGAVKNSCNAYFYHLSQKLGWELIYEYGKKFGLGEITGIDLENEVTGYFVNEEWKKENTNMPKWLPGDTANGAIGQGFTAVTPIQIHNIVSVIVNEGDLYQPHLLKKRKDITTDEITYEPDYEEFKRNEEPIISRDTAVFLKEAMRAVVDETGGTAWRAKTSEIAPIAGKTSTVQVPNQEKDHALFTCFAPYDSKDKEDIIAVTVVVENAGFGGVVAAPIATAIVRYIFEGVSPEKSFTDMGVPYVPPESEFEKIISENYLVSDDDSDENTEYYLSSIQSVISDKYKNKDEGNKKDIIPDDVSDYDSALLTHNTTNDNEDERETETNTTTVKEDTQSDESETEKEIILASNDDKKVEAEKERIRKEQERIKREEAEKERIRKEQERIKREEAEKERIRKEQERIKREEAEKERIRREENEQERIKREEAEKERIRKEKEEKERLKKEQERVKKEKEKREKLKKEQEKLLEKEKKEKEEEEKKVDKAIEKTGKDEDDLYTESLFDIVSTDPLAEVKGLIDEEAKKILEEQEKSEDDEDDEDEDNNDDKDSKDDD